MDGSQKVSRISRLKLENVAPANHYKPVTQRNNVFCRIKRNTAVLSRIDNSEDITDLISNSQAFHGDSRLHSMSKKPSMKQMKQSRRYGSRRSSLESANSLKKRKVIQPLPEIRKSKQISLPSNNKSLAYDDSLNSSKNQIQGTKIGVLSTKQILKQYEIKKLTQELSKKQFLDDYIKNLKDNNYQADEEQEDINVHITQSEHALLGRLIKTYRAQSPTNKSMNLSQSQQKLTDLLENRLTDRDYIDFNVKLFEKRDINKKKFFQRYHNILKQQRVQISQK